MLLSNAKMRNKRSLLWRAIEGLGGILLNVKDRAIRIEGHSDDAPIPSQVP